MNKFELRSLLNIALKQLKSKESTLVNELENCYRDILVGYLTESPKGRVMTMDGHTISLRGGVVYDSGDEVKSFITFFSKNQELFDRIEKSYN